MKGLSRIANYNDLSNPPTLFSGSTFNLQPYFKLNINRILSKDYFNSVFIVSGKYEFKMGLEIEGCSSFKSPSCANPLGAPLSPHLLLIA